MKFIALFLKKSKFRVYLWIFLLEILNFRFSFSESQYKENAILSLSVSKDGLASQDALIDLSMTTVELHKILDNKISNYDNIILNIFNICLLRPVLSSYTAVLFPHEFFGHGVRAHELGQKLSKFEIGLFRGSADAIPSKNCSFTVWSIFHLGGNEATYHLSEKIKLRILKNGLCPTYAWSYLLSTFNQAGYVYILPSSDGHDLEIYSACLANQYGANFANTKNLLLVGWLDLVNPMLFYSLYSIATNSKFYPSMIRIKNFELLPYLRLRLAPYGIEKQISIDSRFNNVILKTFFKFGSTMKVKDKNYKAAVNSFDEKSFRNVKNIPDLQNLCERETTFSVGFELNSIKINEYLDLDMLSEVWRQPILFDEKSKENYINPICAEIEFGGMLALTPTITINKFVTSIMCGYKTQGYTNGFAVLSGAILKFNVGWNFVLGEENNL